MSIARHHGRPAAGLRQHAPILLNFPHDPLLHHGSLDAPARLQPLPQEPQHALAVHADRARTSLLVLLLGRLRGSRAAASCCPRPERAEAEPGIFLPREGGFGALPELLGVGEVADAGVELAQELFCLGVDFFFLAVGEVSWLR
jgi:hypothetical protein